MKSSKVNSRRREFCKASGMFMTGLFVAPLATIIPSEVKATEWSKLDDISVPPIENVDQTFARLFGNRKIEYSKTKVSFIAPNVAENGAVVPVMIESKVPISGSNHVKKIYIIVDKNKRPHAATFEFTPETGTGYAAINTRVGKTTWIRAIMEMNDGTLIGGKKEVKVVVGGCGG